MLLRSKVSPEQAFKYFDSSKDGRLDKNEFKKALELMRVHDLQPQEISVVWDALDIDKSGYIEFTEFNRKLELYGVRNRSSEEVILTQILEAAQKSMKNLSELF